MQAEEAVKATELKNAEQNSQNKEEIEKSFQELMFDIGECGGMQV